LKNFIIYYNFKMMKNRAAGGVYSSFSARVFSNEKIIKRSEPIWI